MSQVRAAGIMYLCGTSVLLLRRTKAGDHAGTWAFPGGKVEEGESLQQAARRESLEEIGHSTPDNLSQIDYSGSKYVEFTTFLCKCEKFSPVLDGEHSGYVWAELTDLPEPLHPGTQATLEKFVRTRMNMDSARQYDGNGWYEIKRNPLSKVGVFPYLGRSIGAPKPDDIYYVYRPAEELSHPETIESFKLIPWIDDHTMLGSSEDGLTPPEHKGISGVIGEEVFFEDGLLYGNIKAFSENMALKIDKGEKRELSAGYRCIYDFTPGEWNGVRYDAVQRNIRGNHLALVAEGRMGPDVAVLDHLKFTFDTKEFVMTEEEKAKKAAEDAALQAAKDAAEAEAKEKAEKEAADAEEAAAKEKAAADAEEAAKAEAMDSKAKIAQLTADMADFKKNAFKTFAAQVATRNALAEDLSQHIGAFDHADKTINEVAEYGVKKLGIQCEKGEEHAVLKGYLAAKKSNSLGFALDSSEKKSGELEAYINGNGKK